MTIWQKIKKRYYRVRNRAFKITTLRAVFPQWYNWCARKGVEDDKIVFVELRLAEMPNSFQVLYEKLEKEYNFKIKCCFLRDGFVRRREYFWRCMDMIREIATAKYIFIAEGSNVISTCPLRKETSLVQLWHGCGAFKKFGFSTADLIFGGSREEQIKYPLYKNYTFATVSSPEVIWAYAEAMLLEEHKDIIRPLGTSRTDIFFDENFLAQARKHLLDLIPGAEGKKIILYAPTFRGRVARAKTPRKLNIELLNYALGDEYILLIKHHPVVKELPAIPDGCEDFAFDVTHSMTIEDLLCVADICISDYSSVIFEYSLFERPMLFFAYDLDDYFDWRGFYYPYDNTFLPGPIVKTTKEIIDYVKHPEKFDLGQVRAFREKFMSSCDGHATERILQEALGSDLEKYKKIDD